MQALALLLAGLALASARRGDQDFEFDDDALQAQQELEPRRPRRYIYDPHNPLCRALQCGGGAGGEEGEVCVLRDAFTALCASKQDILRRGDSLVTAAHGERDEDDDVFYEPLAPAAAPAAAPDRDSGSRGGRCVGCGAAAAGGGRARFVCGSDNRTYSSLCRLDLHNCVRRPRRAVAPVCRGFCPCAAPPAAPDAPAAPATPLAADGAPAPRRRLARRGRRPTTTQRNYDEHGDVALQEWWLRQSEAAHNEALPERGAARAPRRRPAKVAGCALEQMADRLLDWFSVLMDEAGAEPPSEEGFPRDCKPEVRWMFTHLDTDGDGRLSDANLYALRHDSREQCLRPFLASCAGGAVPRAAWCACLRRAARPCTALARAHAARGGGGGAGGGGAAPACDARGFYAPRQCHRALGVCWCVTPHGQELAGSRTKGEPACGAAPRPPAGAPDDDEDAGGSGDAELRF